LLPEARSVDERDRLLGELQGLTGAEALATWAHAILPIKNTLLLEHARTVETAFARKLTAGPRAGPLAETETESETASAVGTENTIGAEIPACSAASPQRRRRKPPGTPAAPRIDMSTLAFPEPRRLRDREHLKFVARQPCLICGRTPSDPHHLRFAQPRALSRKVSDEVTVPLCRTHHRQIHRTGNEPAWWAGNRIEPLPLAAALWRRTHPLPGSAADETKPIPASGSA
jgi:hypothetical protein